MGKKALLVLIWTILFIINLGYAQKVTIYGYVLDTHSGEALIGASIVDTISGQGTVSDSHGYYTLEISVARSCLQVSYVGYAPKVDCRTYTENTFINIELTTAGLLETVEVMASPMEFLDDPMPGMVNIPVQALLARPQIGSEADILKSLSLLPGIAGGVEGTSSLFIRGSSPDQNLILLDGAPVYNATHLGAHFSVFNPDVIKSVKLMKAGMPAQYGGRVSSLLDIRLKEGDRRAWRGKIGLGLLTSRLLIEGPLVQEKTSLLLAVRSSYWGLLAARRDPEGLKSYQNYWLYDLNGKIAHHFSDKQQLIFSVYNGLDKAGFGDAGRNRAGFEYGFDESLVNWGNLTSTLRYHTLIGSAASLNGILYYTRYNYENSLEDKLWNEGSPPEISREVARSENEDRGAKIVLDLYTRSISFNAGTELIAHQFLPTSQIENNDISTQIAARNSARTLAFFAGGRMWPDKTFTLDISTRYSLYQIAGEQSKYLEPRAFFRWRLKKNMSVKGAFNYGVQPIHLLSSSGLSLPNDIWVGSTANIPLQEGWQASSGIFQQWTTHDIHLEMDLFYKKMSNLIDFKGEAAFLEYSSLAEWEQLVETGGRGQAWGLEMLLRKQAPKYEVWLSYTLSWNNRQFETINGGRPFPFRFDRRHDFSISGVYKHNDRWQFSGAGVFQTGYAITVPKATIPTPFNNRNVPVINERNNGRMPVYHRLDLSAEKHWTGKKDNEKVLSFSIYNLYNRINPYYIRTSSFALIENGEYRGERVSLVKVGLFSFIPSVSYSFSFGKSKTLIHE